MDINDSLVLKRVYAKNFKRLKVELTEGSAHQKKMEYTADVHAMGLGGDAFFEVARKDRSCRISVDGLMLKGNP
ncbi:hypothetical protein PsorP6_010169 [Peronosclerospora sorghi]|uniref:Uncharacterized protein n=1 Tax=Peronosclerospora sorghi TaxID=230839 RepID=A0ACC0VW26_9STRA|nr:hypothetical protein PsorP6_010169 [Peronosclerospora sorghi]